MTPAEHLAEAEGLLVQSYGGVATQDPGYTRELVSKAIAHALIAAAAELGVPHAPEATGGGSVPAG